MARKKKKKTCKKDDVEILMVDTVKEEAKAPSDLKNSRKNM